MNYYLIAGEASGDLHAANLMQALKEKDPQATFRFYGGDRMHEQGGTMVRHYRNMAFMGFIEVLRNLSRIFKLLKEAKKDLLQHRPDALILVDFPGFNLRMAAFAKEHGIRTVYYISPKVWAWNQKRVLKIKKVVDQMLVILPFETDFYREWNMPVTYVGNPLLDAIGDYAFDADFLQKHQLEGRPLIALLPGSRKQEIERILPEMLKMPRYFPEYNFAIAGAPAFAPEFYRQFMSENMPVVFNQTYDLLRNSTAALVTSGTATLETALLKVPQIVCYKGNTLSVWIARMLIKVRFISLVNLVADREIVKELIQEDFNEKALKEELERILKNRTYRQTQLQGYEELMKMIGDKGASARAASAIVACFN